MKEDNTVEEQMDQSEFEAPTDEELSGPTEEEENFELPYIIELEYPVQVTKGKTIEKLIFQNRIRGEFLEHLPVDTGQGALMKFGHFFPIIAGMTGETVRTARKLDRDDLLKCIKVVTHFL